MLLLTTGNWKSLLLGSDSVLHALVGIAQRISGLLQKAASSILGLSGLVGCSLSGVGGSLLCLLPLLPCDIASLVGLVLCSSCSIGSGLLRLLPFLAGDITSLVCLVSGSPCYLIRLILGGSRGVLLKNTPNSSGHIFH